MAPPTETDYRKAVTDMLAHFDRLPALQAKARNVRLLQIAYAWTAQIHRFARAVLTLVDTGFEHEATVLVRSMLEYTITLHWLVEVGDQAVDAVMRQHQRALRNVKRSASKGDGMLLPDEAIDGVLALDIPQVDEESTLRHFEQICAQHGIEHNLYVCLSRPILPSASNLLVRQRIRVR